MFLLVIHCIDMQFLILPTAAHDHASRRDQRPRRRHRDHGDRDTGSRASRTTSASTCTTCWADFGCFFGLLFALAGLDAAERPPRQPRAAARSAPRRVAALPEPSDRSHLDRTTTSHGSHQRDALRHSRSCGPRARRHARSRRARSGARHRRPLGDASTSSSARSCSSSPSALMLPIFTRVQNEERARKIDNGPNTELDDVRQAEMQFLGGRSTPRRRRSTRSSPAADGRQVDSDPMRPFLLMKRSRSQRLLLATCHRTGAKACRPSSTLEIEAKRPRSMVDRIGATVDPELTLHRRTRLPVPAAASGSPASSPSCCCSATTPARDVRPGAQRRTFRALSGTSTSQPGTDYRILNVSIDPRETAEMAQSTRKQNVPAPKLAKTGGDDAWRVLVGDEDQHQEALTETVGFNYYWSEATQPVRAPAVADLPDTPKGKVSRIIVNTDLRARGPAPRPRRSQRRHARHLLGPGQAQLPDLRLPHQQLLPHRDDDDAHRWRASPSSSSAVMIWVMLRREERQAPGPPRQT
jgi:hypothetical protein